jgi:hypothetical protein
LLLRNDRGVVGRLWGGASGALLLRNDRGQLKKLVVGLHEKRLPQNFTFKAASIFVFILRDGEKAPAR